MSFLKFLFYVVAAYLVIRFINRLLSPKAPPRGNTGNTTQKRSTHQDQPKFNIEADTVDYEIIEEEKEKDEK
ncbi:MAG: hypothetical protein H3C39_03825 [Flavobacteriia bacterium]|nr:hypothetical protein [Flavobacteriia bacterium]